MDDEFITKLQAAGAETASMQEMQGVEEMSRTQSCEG